MHSGFLKRLALSVWVLTWLGLGLARAEPKHTAQPTKEEPSSKEGAKKETPPAEPAPGPGSSTAEGEGAVAQPESEPLPPAEGEALPPAPEGFKQVTMDAATASKPPLNILDLHGYLRFRGDLAYRLSLGLPAHAGFPSFPKEGSGHGESLSSGNMRFRLEPTINISEDVRVMSQIDFLDNLVLGSTPNSFPSNPNAPLAMLSETQNPPSAGKTYWTDSLRVKRVWGEVLAPNWAFRFGRMGANWGLGLWQNDGGPMHRDRGPQVTSVDPFSPMTQCFDCDYGTTIDGLVLVTKFAGHYIVPILDFTSEGPGYPLTTDGQGQPVDFDQLDDVNSYTVIVARMDKPEDVKNALEKDGWNLNYGLNFTYRHQASEAVQYETDGNPDLAGTQTSTGYTSRKADLFVPDVWVRFLWRKLRVELEAVAVLGKIGNAPTYDAQGALSLSGGGDLDVTQVGGVLQSDYSLLNDQLVLGMEVGFASGDKDAKGMGLNPLVTNSGTGQVQHINNYRFNRDYHVDLILWRQIMTRVSNAMYFKPTLQYNISETLGSKISAIYSSAVCQESTRGKAYPLGLEFDADLFYFSGDKFHAGVSYGLMIPFDGMDELGTDNARGDGIAATEKDNGAELAHRFLLRMVLYF